MLIKRSKIYWVKFVIIIATAFTLISWGKYGHEHINHAAVMALPGSLQRFFFNHIDFITTEANVPDLRKYVLKDSAEFPRHHIHLERYGNIDSVPKSSIQAYSKYSSAFFFVNGKLPWYIQDVMVKLTDAFKHKRKNEILFLAADLGHYIGDAYMPLHASANHNGTLTNHKGAHSMFESHLPEIFGDGYNYNVGQATYVDDVQKETWRIVIASNKAADTLLKADRDLTKKFDADQIFEKDAFSQIKNNMYNEPVHTDRYVRAYHAQLNGMVERQLRGAIKTTASYWYTAWVNAGKPNLSELDTRELTLQNTKYLSQELTLYKKGKLSNIKSENEF